MGSLDRRTLAICATIAFMAAIAAALVATAVLGDDDTTATGDDVELELTEPGGVNVDRLLSVALEDADGTPTDLDTYLDGRPMVVNLWQSSCVPCIDEMPLLEQGATDNPDVKFLGVATQDRLEKALELADQTGITYPWTQDLEGNLFYEAGGIGMPTTLLLDADGTVLASDTGAFADQPAVQAFIDDHLD